MKSIKIKLLFISSVLLFTLVECKVKKKTIALEEIPFNYPEEIVESAKPGFVTDYKKGHMIYNMNCAKCHNKTIDGKSVIPDFSLPQLMDYEIRFAYPEHQEPMRETTITQDELEYVILFLRYKKPGPSASSGGRE